MYDVITEDSPEFNAIDKTVRSYRERINFDRLAIDIHAMVNSSDRGDRSYISLVYPHDQVSNIISALRRRELINNIDYKIVRTFREGYEDSGELRDQILIISTVTYKA